MSTSVEYLKLVVSIGAVAFAFVLIRGFFEIRKMHELMQPYVDKLDHQIGCSMYSKLKSLDEIAFAMNHAGVPEQLKLMYNRLDREGFTPTALGHILNLKSRHKIQWWVGAAPAPLRVSRSITMITDYGDITWGLDELSEKPKNDVKGEG